ncbi:MAG: class I SAM-dependent methyltransferase [Candidatus Daviesbacteria bacterium]|nr:class I SAM-dependent methyltransferase [Candidatus Daviesbacteria bacterium]
MKNSITYAGTKTLETMNQAKFYNKWTFSKFDKYLKGDILEVGCGTGNFSSTLSKYGEVTAIDIDQSLIQKVGEDKSLKVATGYGDIEKGNYFFPEKSFDTVVCINVLEHIKDDERALQNMCRLLKKGGKLILLVPIYNFLYGEIDRAINHFRRYNPEQLKVKLEQIGFTIEESRKLNFLGALGWFIAGRIFKNKQVEDSKIQLFNTIAPFYLFIEDFIEPVIGTSVLIIAQKP